MRSNSTSGRPWLVSWALLLTAAVIFAAARMSGGEWLRSNVFELLPASEYDALREAASRAVDMELGTRLLFLVGHTGRATAATAADRLASSLREHPLVASVTARIEMSRYAAIAEFYHPYRRQLLSAAQIRRIAADPAGVRQAALANLYSPFSGAAASLTTDPFSLFPASLQAMQPRASTLVLDDGYLWADRDGVDYAFITASVGSPALSIAEQEDLARHVDTAIESVLEADSDLEILKTGFAFYAHEATRSAQGEVSTIGVGSLIGLLLLVITTFRSLRPLSLIVISILSGCAIALAVTLSVFGFVHLFTLVFGASLIGVSVDYAFHYVADDAFGADDWTPDKGLRNIFMGITLGLITSILAYLALTVAPFPGLQQLAVFSSAGLIGAWLTLIAVCRLWRRRLTVNRRSIVLRVAESYLALWKRASPTARGVVLVVLGVLIAAGYRTIVVNDDVSQLQAQPPELKRQEAAIQEVLGIAQAGTFLLVAAPAAEQLLQLEEELQTDLRALLADGSISGYEAVSRWVPSAARQRHSHSVYAELVRAELPAFYGSLGMAEDTVAGAVAELAGGMTVLDIEAWLAHPVSEQLRRLWVDTAGAGAASIMLLYGVGDVAAIEEAFAARPSVQVVNKGRDLSSLFGKYRARVAQMLVIAYLVILFGLSFRYGLRRAATLLVPPVFAGLLALAAVSAGGGTLNLFNLLALILVLGIGIDFTLFIAEVPGEHRSTMFAITLSALTTMLSFGLLSLSSTYAVHSFGLTVLVGIACAYLLAPLAVDVRPRSRFR